MSSYNFVKAIGDGIAEEINYRHNQKRKRRDEEYNYNLQKQRAEKEREEAIARNYDFLSRNNVENIDFTNPNQVQLFNMNAQAEGMPFSVSVPKAVNNSRIDDQIKLMQMRHSLAKNLIDYKRANAAPKQTPESYIHNEYELLVKHPELWDKLASLRYGSRTQPQAVKEQAPYHWSTDKEARQIWQDIAKEFDDLDTMGIDESGTAKAMFDISNSKLSDEEKAKQLQELKKIAEANMNNSNEQIRRKAERIGIMIDLLHNHVYTKSGGRSGFDKDIGFYDLDAAQNKIKSGLGSLKDKYTKKSNERAGIAQNRVGKSIYTPSVNPFDNSDAGKPKSIRMSFEEGQDPEALDVYNKAIRGKIYPWEAGRKLFKIWDK